jgi:nucleotide-binding universal stress UspA family protein
MPGFDHLVVALGCAEGDADLIAYASMISTLGDAKEVRFVHVAESSGSAAQVRERMREKVTARFSAKAWTQCDVLHGPLTDRLLAYVSEYQADLILMGSKKHKLGARLAMVAPCSVAVVPAGWEARLSHMLIAIDFSDAAADTLQWATSLASGDRSIRCTALHVMTRESVDLFAENESEPEQAEAMRTILARADRNGVTVVPRLVGARQASEIGRRNLLSLPSAIQGAAVAEAILDAAEECGADCIALATRGRSASASILLGSVTEKVIERATIPLLVGKHFGASLGLTEILLGRAGWHSTFKTN